MNWIVDRIEGRLAVLETASGGSVTVPISHLPDGVSEGDVISLRIDRRLTRRTKRAAARRLKRLTGSRQPG